LFFDDVRDESGCARDHEYPVERCRIHSQVGENGADRAVYIDREVFLCHRERLLDGARSFHMHTINTRFACRFEQTCSAQVLGVEAMTFC
jgi:hypothetical protein